MSRLVALFQQALRRRPILTNSLVYATFYTAAELSQQTYNKIYSPSHPDLDLAGAGRIAAAGSTLYAPTLYVWYKFLDKRFVGTAVKTVVAKVLSDQFLMSPILLASFYTLIGILEQSEDIFRELREKYWKTFIAAQIFWMPAQTINFFYIRSQFRVVYVASVSFIWINVLCFIKREKKEIEEILHIDVDVLAPTVEELEGHGDSKTMTGILEQNEDIFMELREKYWKTFIANQIFWIPAQTINFLYIRSQFRVVYVASMSFIWINVLCFIKREKKEIEKILHIDVDVLTPMVEELEGHGDSKTSE